MKGKRCQCKAIEAAHVEALDENERRGQVAALRSSGHEVFEVAGGSLVMRLAFLR